MCLLQFGFPPLKKMHALLSTPAFLSSVSGALLGAEGARRMACVSRCWRANIRTEHPQRHEEDDDAAEAFRAARSGEACWARAVASPASAEASRRDSRACTIMYALLRLGVVGGVAAAAGRRRGGKRKNHDGNNSSHSSHSSNSSNSSHSSNSSNSSHSPDSSNSSNSSHSPGSLNNNNRQRSVCVHSVGTDAVEGATVADTLRVFAALRRMLGAYGVRKLVVVLNGMDLVVPKDVAAEAAAVRAAAEHAAQDLLLCGSRRVTVGGPAAAVTAAMALRNDGDDVGALVETELVWEPGVYSADMYDALCASGRAPDAVFCFNAGLWGYDTWRGTVRMIMRKGAPLVVTSYTFQEADDDEDVMREEMAAAKAEACAQEKAAAAAAAATEGVPKGGGAKALCFAWPAECNPFGSTREIPSFHAGEVLRENSFWMCAATL
jgi:hypothetical protein